MKKLTDNYFKKSAQSEKAVILHKELTSQKLHFALHKKNTKSLSLSGNQKLPKLSKPFTEDMIELPDKSSGAPPPEEKQVNISSDNFSSQQSAS